MEVSLLIWCVVPLLIWEVATAYLSKGILYPTLALIRAQLRIQVPAECGNKRITAEIVATASVVVGVNLASNISCSINLSKLKESSIPA